jgi:hypothetical protein
MMVENRYAWWGSLHPSPWGWRKELHGLSTVLFLVRHPYKALSKNAKRTDRLSLGYRE